MNTQQEQVAQLWDNLQVNYGPTITPQDEATLAKLDALACDGELSEGHLKATQRRLMAGRKRQYAVTEGGKIAPAYWQARDSKGSTNLSLRKSINGSKNITQRRLGKGKVFVVSIGTGGTRVNRKFTTAGEAHLFRDCEVEARRTITQSTKQQARDLNHEEDRIKVLATAKFNSETRKAALREAMKPDPVTGITPSFSEVLRRPEFDKWSGAPKQRPTKAKSVDIQHALSMA